MTALNTACENSTTIYKIMELTTHTSLARHFPTPLPAATRLADCPRAQHRVRRDPTEHCKPHLDHRSLVLFESRCRKHRGARADGSCTQPEPPRLSAESAVVQKFIEQYIIKSLVSIARTQDERSRPCADSKLCPPKGWGRVRGRGLSETTLQGCRFA